MLGNQLLGLGTGIFREVGVDGTGLYFQHANGKRRQFHAQGIAQCMHCRLGGAIGPGKRRHQYPGNTADIDYQPLVATQCCKQGAGDTHH